MCNIMLNITDRGKQFKPMIGMIQGRWWIPDKIKYRFPKALESCWLIARVQENEKRWSTAKQITTNRCNHEGWRSVFARLHQACMRAPLLSLNFFSLCVSAMFFLHPNFNYILTKLHVGMFAAKFVGDQMPWCWIICIDISTVCDPANWQVRCL